MNISKSNFKLWMLELLIAVLMLSCGKGSSDTRFELLSSDATGVTFANRLEETPEMNIFSYLYFYNGGGVATGDFNGDGLQDLYFTSNLENNALYLNKGNFQFEDITASAKVAGKKGWTTGVTIADVNADGRLDIYVSQLGDYKNIRGKNQLYINMGNDASGIPVFEEKAKDYGLDLVGFSTQAVFFDYDLDGDLDMFMLNHSVHSNGTYGKANIRTVVHPLAGDKLLRNDGGKFVNVSQEAGIYSSALGYGLGVTVADINWDGYPDIYVGNDFHENDYLYINQGDGTFKEMLDSCIMHTSRYSMGNDIGDINNDGLPDILSLDMMPADPAILKASAGEDGYDVFNFKLTYGYSYQFARNTLQLNMGNGSFSEIATLAGVHATDWSWSPLIADFDLDGNKDIFISNGIKRRLNDMDYINFISNDAVINRLEGDLTEGELKLVEKMPVVKIPNYLYRNDGNLKFQDVSAEWGVNQESFSNGAVYVDLDNDGDLDLVVNNIDQEAFIYRNNTISKDKKDNNYLKIKFEGRTPNTQGIGAKVIVPVKNGMIVQEMFNTRGFQSAVGNEIIIGVEKDEVLDSVVIIWPDKTLEVLKQVKANQQLVVKQINASGKYNYIKSNHPVFSDITPSFNAKYKHHENKFVEFDREPLIPYMTSAEGPKIAVGDINGDGLEDFFIGGAKRQSGAIFIQTPEGFAITLQPALKADSVMEDVGAEFVDVDNDQDLDLIVVSGGSEFAKKDKETLVRLYVNDGKGLFSRNVKAIPEVYVTGSVVRAGDFDKDGYNDLFVGGRTVPGNFGASPSSYLLKNKGNGSFEDVTDLFASDLKELGMIKDAVWADIDKDGKLDLIVAGEWMPITIFLNKGKSFTKIEVDGISEWHGWWNTVMVADINSDGLPDIIAGNLGLNSKLKASEEKPVSLYIGDFDDNSRTEQLLMYYIGDKEYLFASKDEIGKQMPFIKNKFLKYADFAKANVNDIIPDSKLKKSKKLYANEFRSGVFVNNGKMAFEFQPFPVYAQLSPIQSLVLLDYDNDMHTDILTGGNMYEVSIQQGRYDADFGALLRNNGKGSFNCVPNLRSGLNVKGQVRDIKLLQYEGGSLALFAINNDSLKFMKLNNNKGSYSSDK